MDAVIERYVDHLQALIGRVMNVTRFPDSVGAFVAVESGVVFADAMLGRAFRQTPPGLLPQLTSRPLPHVRDAQGASRPEYPGLLVYALLQAHSGGNASHEGASSVSTLIDWCDALIESARSIDWPRGPLLAAWGANAVRLAWAARTAHVASLLNIRAGHRGEWATATFERLIERQLTEGPFLAACLADPPERWWYDELVLLHAIAGYAIDSGSPSARSAVFRATEYHLNETQPDHATHLPWGLPAFIWNPAARPLADQVLHSVAVHHPEGPDAVSLILLADALYCARRIQRE